MDQYKQPYLVLWAGITEALAELEKRNYGAAEEILIKAQQAAEEEWISAEEPNADTRSSARAFCRNSQGRRGL